MTLKYVVCLEIEISTRDQSHIKIKQS